jgi:hypothetical protein
MVMLNGVLVEKEIINWHLREMEELGIIRIISLDVVAKHDCN